MVHTGLPQTNLEKTTLLYQDFSIIVTTAR